MDAAVGNMLALTHEACSLASAVKMATAVPVDTLGRLRPGYTADITALDGQLRVVATWTCGPRAFER